MLESESIQRSTLRGLKKCPSCHHYNGNRAKSCSNKNCQLYCVRKGSIDPVQLITFNEVKIYSVLCKERSKKRSFVQITDTTLPSDVNECIISRSAICFVDTCKCDTVEVTSSCKHIKGAIECKNKAEEVKISKDILNGLKVNQDVKASLFNLYSENNNCKIPILQRLTKTTFVVKCIQNNNFPAGRLHLTVKTDDDGGEFNYTCACKKLKILLSPNDTIVVENDVCDHLLLLLAGILSSKSLQEKFQNLLKELKIYWDRADDCQTFDGDFLLNEELYNFDESILDSVIELNDNEILPTNIFQMDTDSNTNEIETELQIENENQTGFELVEMSFTSTETQTIFNTNLDADNNECLELADSYTEDNEYLELADCQIELMDQFKLTDQIDLCNDEVLLSSHDLQLEVENNMKLVDCIEEIKDCDKTVIVEEESPRSNAVTNDNISKNIIKKINNTTEKKTAQLLKRKSQILGDNLLTEPSSTVLEFNEWMNFVIEQINMKLDANLKNKNIKHIFSIKNDFFKLFTQKFAINGKQRIPNSTVVVKEGQYKGLIQTKWIFSSSTMVKRIFSTNDSSIELERYFTKTTNEKYKFFDLKQLQIDDDKRYKKIRPKLYCVFIKLDSKENGEKHCLTIDWIPNVFPKSKFGQMQIEFSIEIKQS